ncbi:MAG: HEPN domain-containing protein [Gammaproteobacteria bacterium]
MAKFSWPAYPSTELEFEELMAAADNALAAEELKPFQRPAHVGRLFWEAFEWGGRMSPPDEMADRPGYQGDVLMAKALRWYTETLGNRLKSYFELGHVPARLAQTIWLVRIANWCGSVEFFLHRNLLNKGSSKGSQTIPPSMNVLTLIDDLPQGLVDRLTDNELEAHFMYHMFAVENIQWLNNLPRTNMLNVAIGDYASSTHELLAHRYPQSRWAAQQCVEKSLKGFLHMAGTPFPKGGKDGHNLSKLAKIFYDEHGVSINPQLIQMAHCSTGTRYQDEPSTEDQAFRANVAALNIFDTLKKSPGVKKILENHYKNNPML